MAALAEAGTDQPERHYYELETRWVQDKKSNCASEVGVVEDILDQLYQADADAFISCVFPGAGVSP
jgi:hypothetical protein